MKNLLKTILFSAIIFVLMGCGFSQKTTLDEFPADQTKISSETESTYPVETEDTAQSYPVEEIHNTEIPGYLLPGFVTSTPDVSMVNIIISEVKHENGVEIITIENRGESTQDISAFMVYSPALDERKILTQKLILDPGGTYHLYNGTDTSAYPYEQRWLQQTILNDAMDEVWLTNDSARIIYYFVYYPPVP